MRIRSQKTSGGSSKSTPSSFGTDQHSGRCAREEPLWNLPSLKRSSR
jgi:hypothetical protein